MSATQRDCVASEVTKDTLPKSTGRFSIRELMMSGFPSSPLIVPDEENCINYKQFVDKRQQVVERVVGNWRGVTETELDPGKCNQ